MTRLEFSDALERLRLSTKEAAALLSVDPKTALRWQQGVTDIPGPVEQALRAWLRLDAMGLPWHPGAALLGLSEEEAAKQIRRHREENLKLVEIIDRVRANGGPAAPWKVDLKKRSASLGGVIEIGFYALKSGGFSPQAYHRLDRNSDIERDRQILEDGYVAIADAIAKAGPGWAD